MRVDDSFARINLVEYRGSCCLCKLGKLLESVIALGILHTHQDRALTLGILNHLCNASESVVRVEYLGNKCLLRQLERTERTVNECLIGVAFLDQISEVGRIELSGLAVKNSKRGHAVELA